MEEVEEEKQESIKNGIMTGKQFNDSLWELRFSKYPGRFDTIQLDWKRELAYSKWMLEKDSLRSDSIIRELAGILGPPLREGPTPHTEKDSRYFATWIKNGYSCSLKDFRKYSEVNFTISPAPVNVITEFNLPGEVRMIEKAIIEVRDEIVEVSLMGVPMMQGSGVFKHFYLLALTASGSRYLDEMPEELQGGSNPGFSILDLTGDGIKDIWLHYETLDGSGCTNNLIYTMELLEPLMIFEPMESLEYDLDGEFQDDFRALVAIDKSARTYIKLNQEDPAYENIYDNNGRLLQHVSLKAGQTETLESHPYGEGKAHQFRALLPVWGVSKENKLAYVQAVWDYNSGGWDLTSLEIWED